MTTSPLRLTVLAVLIGLSAAFRATAQDLEPTLNRAAARLSVQMVDRLAHHDGNLFALVLPEAAGTDAGAVDAVRGALVDSGFRVLDGDDAGTRDDVLALGVSVVGGDPHSRLVVAAEDGSDLRLTCAYGAANWADRVDDDALLVEGPLRTDQAAAVNAARDLARRRIEARAGVDSQEEDILQAVAHRTFVGAEERRSGRLHRAYVRVDLGDAALRRVREASDGARRRRLVTPWARVGGVALLALLLLPSYLCLDLRTRGYMSGRLKMLFGMLFVIGTGVWWRALL